MSKENQIAMIKAVAGEFGLALKSKLSDLRLEIDKKLNERDGEFRVDVDAVKQQLSLVAEKIVDIESTFEETMSKFVADIDGKFESKDVQFLDFCQKQTQEFLEPHIQAIEQIEKSLSDISSEVDVARDLRKGIDAILDDYGHLSVSVKELNESIGALDDKADIAEVRAIEEKVQYVNHEIAKLAEKNDSYGTIIDNANHRFESQQTLIEQKASELNCLIEKVADKKPDPSDIFFAIKEIPEFQICISGPIDQSAETLRKIQTESNERFSRDLAELKQDLKELAEAEIEFDLEKFLESDDFQESVFGILKCRFEQIWNKHFAVLLDEKAVSEIEVKKSLDRLSAELDQKLASGEFADKFLDAVKSEVHPYVDSKITESSVHTEENILLRVDKKNAILVDLLQSRLDGAYQTIDSLKEQLTAKAILRKCSDSKEFHDYIESLFKSVSEPANVQIKTDMQTELERAKAEIKENLHLLHETLEKYKSESNQVDEMANALSANEAFDKTVSKIADLHASMVEAKLKADFNGEINTAKSALNEKLNSLIETIADIQKKVDAEIHYEVDVDQLACDLQGDKQFIKTIDDSINKAAKQAHEDTVIKLEKHNHDLITKSMVVIEEMAKAYFKSLPKPKDGEKGEKGDDGLGLEIDQYQKGEIYLKDNYVQTNFGQFFKALKNTNEVPSVSKDWKRIGTSGFRWIKHKPKNPETLQEGDFYIDGGSGFMCINGKAQMIVQRGKNGVDGKDGKDGKCGKDAATIVDIQCEENALVFVMSDGHIFEVENTLAKTLKQAVQAPEPPDQDALEMKWFRGAWHKNKQYGKGDVVSNGKSLYLAAMNPIKGVMSAPHWIPMLEAE